MPTPSPSLPGDQEQRASVRYHSNPETPLFRIGEHDEIHTWKAKVDDVSEGGLGLHVTNPFDVGSIVDVELSVAGIDATKMLVARVVRIEPNGAYWRVACALETRLSPDEVQMIANDHCQPSGQPG